MRELFRLSHTTKSFIPVQNEKVAIDFQVVLTTFQFLLNYLLLQKIFVLKFAINMYNKIGFAKFSELQ